MRLRNIPEAKDIVNESVYVLRYPSEDPRRIPDLFPEEKPLRVEIGMGKGQFLFAMAAAHPEYNFLGVERYESVLFRAVQRMEESVTNLRFACMDAVLLPELLGEGSVDRLYLNFSDPWPKARHAKRRLTSPEFLAVYTHFLKKDGILEFKTDNVGLFDFSVESVTEAADWELLSVTRDLHRYLAEGEENFMTEYERKFSNLGNKILKLTARYAGIPEKA